MGNKGNVAVWGGMNARADGSSIRPDLGSFLKASNDNNIAWDEDGVHLDDNRTEAERANGGGPELGAGTNILQLPGPHRGQLVIPGETTCSSPIVAI